MSGSRFEHGTSQIQKRTGPWLWLILHSKHCHVSYTTTHSNVVGTCSGVAMRGEGRGVILMLPRWATQFKGPQNEYFEVKNLIWCAKQILNCWAKWRKFHAWLWFLNSQFLLGSAIVVTRNGHGPKQMFRNRTYILYCTLYSIYCDVIVFQP